MNQWLKPYEYAKKYNKPIQTVYRWIREGRVPVESQKVEEKIVRRLLLKDKEYLSKFKTSNL